MKVSLVQDPDYRLYNMHAQYGGCQEKKPVGGGKWGLSYEIECFRIPTQRLPGAVMEEILFYQHYWCKTKQMTDRP